MHWFKWSFHLGGCRCGLCSADSFNCLMVLYSSEQNMPPFLFFLLFFVSSLAAIIFLTHTEYLFESARICFEVFLEWYLWEMIVWILYLKTDISCVYTAWWCWREDPGNRSSRIHLQHWWLCLAAGEGGKFQALWHPASHVHSPQWGGRRAHVPDPQGIAFSCWPSIHYICINTDWMTFFVQTSHMNGSFSEKIALICLNRCSSTCG